MNLEFPTDLPVPLCSTHPARGVETSDCTSPGEVSELLQNPLDRSDLAPAGVHVDEAGPEAAGNNCSPEFLQEAISAIIRNIGAHPTKGEYIWDPARERWILRMVPI
jgi:hypothetical protein